MFVKRSLFKKYLIITMSILLVSFLLLGIMLWIFISKYWRDEKKQLLQKNASEISDMVERNSKELDPNLYLVDSKMMRGFLNAFSSNIDATIFITNTYGEILISSNDENGNQLKGNIPKPILEQTINNEFYNGTNDLNGLFKEQCYIVSLPIYVESQGSRVLIGTVFTAANSEYISEFRIDILKIFVVVSIMSFLVSFVFVWFSSYSISKPLSQMAKAAERFAKEDFSSRVTVKTDDEIGKLAIAFNNMAESLALSENTRRSFIANVSHELKTPMTTITGFIDGILDGTILKENQDYYLRIISDEIKRLSRLVRTMLDLTRIDNGELKIHKKKFDVSNLVFSILLSFEKQIEEKNINIEGLSILKSVYINGDQDMIYQVIYNLIENAVKFTNENGYIKFDILENTSKITLGIENSGKGIPQKEINFIFDRFYKTDKSRSQDKNGMGLGLYIVKMIVKLHGGNIKVQSEENKFCKFTFSILKDPML